MQSPVYDGPIIGASSMGLAVSLVLRDNFLLVVVLCLCCVCLCNRLATGCVFCMFCQRDIQVSPCSIQPHCIACLKGEPLCKLAKFAWSLILSMVASVATTSLM